VSREQRGGKGGGIGRLQTYLSPPLAGGSAHREQTPNIQVIEDIQQQIARVLVKERLQLCCVVRPLFHRHDLPAPSPRRKPTNRGDGIGTMLAPKTKI